MARYSSILIITMSPFSERDQHRFGVNIFKSYGFKVEICDISNLLYLKGKSQFKTPDSVQARSFKELPDFDRYLNSVDSFKTLAVCLLNFDSVTAPIFSLFKRYDISFLLNNCNIPPPLPPNQLLVSIRRAIQQPDKLVNKFRHSAFLYSVKQNKIGLPNYLLYGGRSSIIESTWAQKGQPIFAHHFDYDRFLECIKNNTPRVIDCEYAVFLDHGTPYHPDNLFLGKKVPRRSRPSSYYPGVLKMLDLVERSTGLKVVIAAHPRWRFEDYPDHYGGRTILRGRTIEMVRDASLVVAHNSTSLTFANIYKKPVFFIHSAAHNPNAIELVARHFGKTAHWWHRSNGIDWDRELRIDEPAYKNYFESYIKFPGTPDLCTWSIVCQHLLSSP